MYMAIETYDSETNEKKVLSAVFNDRTTACVYGQDYVRGNNKDTLYFRVIKAHFIPKSYLDKNKKR